MSDNPKKGTESADQAKKSDRKDKKNNKDDEDCDCGVSIGKNNGVKYVLLTFLILGILAAVVVPILIIANKPNKNDKSSPS